MLKFLKSLWEDDSGRDALRPLYAATVATGRMPFWYREGQIPDTVTGRFDIISSVVALVLLRIEAEGEREAQTSVLLTENFIADMDRSLRELGTGDYVVGKHVGKLVSALGGRLSAYREALTTGADLTPAVRRNVFHDEPPSEDAPAAVAAALQRFWSGLQGTELDAMLAGRLPPI